MCIAFLLATASVYGDALYNDALEQFVNNNPREAAVLFQASLTAGNNDPDVFMYLAYCYEQLGLYEQGIAVLEQGLAFSRDKRYLFYFNLGNLYVHTRDPASAVEQYDLAIGSRPDYAEAYLNRANTRLREWELASALADYQQFIQIAPGHFLVPDIKRMIQAIMDEMQAEESRIREEQRLVEIEIERQRLETLEAEQRAKEEEARRKALLDDILGNLGEAGDDARTLGAGTEDISDEEEDFMRAE